MDLALRLRWRAVRALAGRHEVRARGLAFTLQDENWITNYRWRTYETKEPETLDWLDRSLRDGDVFVDVGANIGLYSVYAALSRPASRVIALEPEYANLHLLRDNLVANGLEDRVTAYSIALGARDGLSFLLVQDLAPGSALHTESREASPLTRTGRRVRLREGISVLTLDTFCGFAGVSPHLMKIDVDGTELDILRGAERTLSDGTLRTILVEVPPGPDGAGIARLLADHGFRREGRPPSASNNEIWSR